MLIDRLMPEFDATRIEHRVVVGRGSDVYAAAVGIDFVDAVRQSHGQWVRLGDDPPNEITFGVVGRFWAGETVWEQIDASDFARFARPGYAKIAGNLSFRPYGGANPRQL